MKNDLCKSVLPCLRDADWVLTGKVPKIEFENKLAKKNAYPHEIEQAKRLSQHGIKCTFQVDYDVDKKTKGTARQKIVGKPDLSSGIELKSLKNTSNHRKRVEKDLRNAYKKKALKECNFDATGTRFTSEEIEKCLRLEAKLRGVKTVSYIDSTGKYYRKIKI